MKAATILQYPYDSICKSRQSTIHKAFLSCQFLACELTYARFEHAQNGQSLFVRLTSLTYTSCNFPTVLLNDD